MERTVRTIFCALATVALLRVPADSQDLRARIAGPIDDGNLKRLLRNTHPLARPEFDQGAAPAGLPMRRMLLVLSPSAQRQQALQSLLLAQQDKSSKQYHRWLTPQEFGQQFGVSDADIAQVTGWLQSHGFSIDRVANGRNLVEFSGTAAQVLEAFHTEIHHYVVNGKDHWANASDPQIPQALAGVVGGVATLHNFRKAAQIATIKPQAVKIAQGSSRPSFTASDGEHALAPGDFATIYNLNPLYNSGFKGQGTTIAVVARTNINMSDIQSFQSSFGVPATLPQVVLNGADPGDLGDGDEAEAVLDTSWSAALAPNATVDLVVSSSTHSTDGVDLSEQYIVNNNLADVMTESYGDCEANYTQAEAQFYSNLAQQAAAQGITYTVASGDSGAEGCDDPGSETVASGPVSVNILSSTPYDIAVGGTEFNENGNSGYWTANNNSTFSSAVSYIPEVTWNESCTVAACGGANAGIWAGSGGASVLFSKPAWQTGVAGIPDDGARDVPDISFSSASHDFYLLCLDGSCTTRRGQSFFSGVSGTSAATPSFAAIMALVVQYTGSRQGQPAPTLYQLAAAETLAACNASAPAANCIFNDVTVGNNAVPGEPNYGQSNAQYQAGVGYDLATGLGSANVANLITNWNSGAASGPQIRIGIESPSSQNDVVIGSETFSGWALADSGALTALTVSIDSVPYGNAFYGIRRTDICNLYSSANCPAVGWSTTVDTTQLPNGPHTFGITATTTTGQVYTNSAIFTVNNWTPSNPTKVQIDVPGASSSAFSGVAAFGGWALSDLAAISKVSVSVDGASYGAATYGGARTDVCNVFPGRPGCPNVGWGISINTASLADGQHTLTVTALTAGGQSTATATNFTVANTPSNTLTTSIDVPSANNSPVNGATIFGGWAIGTTAAVSNVGIVIDGVSFGNAAYGGARADVCARFGNSPGCPNVGWSIAIDTAQLVNGTHLLSVTTYTAAGQHTVQTRIFTVSNASSASPVNLFIDDPNSANNIVVGALAFDGWAVNSANPVSGVAVAIDGSSYGSATYGENRSDVCAVFPSSKNCPNVGWTIGVDTTQLANGYHTVTVTALGTPQNTLTNVFNVQNWAASNPMRASIDSPNAQTRPLSGSVEIGGWVVDQLATISQVNLAVDGVSIGSASYGGARNDVCAIFSGPGCPNVGWSFMLDTNVFSDGAHTLSVTGFTTGGQKATFSGPFTISNSGGNPVRVSIDNPNSASVLSGVAGIGGWALDTTGAAITSVAVLIDGELNGSASWGGSRTDVCARIPSGGGCPNVGWNYLLDTSLFTNGTHTIEVRALAADGKLYTAANTFTIANQP